MAKILRKSIAWEADPAEAGLSESLCCHEVERPCCVSFNEHFCMVQIDGEGLTKIHCDVRHKNICASRRRVLTFIGNRRVHSVGRISVTNFADLSHN